MEDEGCLMCAWKLQRGKPLPSLKKYSPSKCERVIGEDHRERVNPREIQNGGKFRSVVKLFCVLRGKTYQGTGWLIRDDIVVTAGHNVVGKISDQPNSLAFATSVVVYVGYGGKDTVGSKNVHCREGMKVVTSYDWVSKQKPTNDLAFVKLSKRFDNITPIKALPTPPFGVAELCVIGYPGDKQKGREYGAEMYKELAEVEWKLEEAGGLLAYQISTFGGNSGSPVLCVKDGYVFAIGTHVNTINDCNRASPIIENSVNSYSSILARFFGNTWPEPHTTFLSRFFLESQPEPNFADVPIEVHGLYPQSLSHLQQGNNLYLAEWKSAKSIGDPLPDDVSSCDTLSHHQAFPALSAAAGAFIGYALHRYSTRSSPISPSSFKRSYTIPAVQAECNFQSFCLNKEGGLNNTIRSDLFARYEKLRPLVLPFSTELLCPMKQFVTNMAALLDPQTAMLTLLTDGSKARRKNATSKLDSDSVHADLAALVRRALFARAAFDLLQDPRSRASPVFARLEGISKLSAEKAKKLEPYVYLIVDQFRDDIVRSS